MSVITTGVTVALVVVNAAGTLFALATVLMIAIGVEACSRIDMYYESKERGQRERRKREEILLLR
jgi:hypothetical protein